MDEQKYQEHLKTPMVARRSLYIPPVIYQKHCETTYHLTFME